MKQNKFPHFLLYVLLSVISSLSSIPKWVFKSSFSNLMGKKLHFLFCQFIFYNLKSPLNHKRSLKPSNVNFPNVLFLMYMKLDYFFFSAFDLEMNASEILKYLLLFFRKKCRQGQGKIPSLEKKF